MGWVNVRGFRLNLRGKNFWGGVGVFWGVGLWGIGCPLLASMWVQFPIYRLMGGIGYYRFPAVIPWIEIGLAVLLVVLPFLLSALPALKKKPVFYGVLQVVAVTLFGYYYVVAGCGLDKGEAMEAEQLGRKKKWQEIRTKVEGK